jgi:hypothetical protein
MTYKMTKQIVVTMLVLVMTSAAFAEVVPASLPPRVPRQEFVAHLAAAMAAVLYCKDVELNDHYIQGYEDASGLNYPTLEADFSEEFTRREKEVKRDPAAYCRLAVEMYQADGKPGRSLPPLLVSRRDR